MQTGAKDILGVILPSLRYNTCPCLLPIQVSRLPSSSSEPSLLSTLSQLYTWTAFRHKKLPPAGFSQKQLLFIFTLSHLLQRPKRVNNEPDDGGGRDGRSLRLDQQAARGGRRGPQLEMCPWLPGALQPPFKPGNPCDCFEPGHIS